MILIFDADYRVYHVTHKVLTVTKQYVLVTAIQHNGVITSKHHKIMKVLVLHLRV